MKVIDVCGIFEKGYVYFMRAGYFGPIKIGFTKNVKKRVRNLQTACPEKLNILCVLKTNKKTEEAYHRMYNDVNINGEWFHPTKKLLKEIDTMAKAEMKYIHFDPEITDQWCGMNEIQWESWMRYKEKRMEQLIHRGQRG